MSCLPHTQIKTDLLRAVRTSHAGLPQSQWLLAILTAALCTTVVVSQTCAPPSFGSAYEYSACQSLTRCQTCSVSCKPGTVGSRTTLQCLGEEDELRNYTTGNSSESWLDYSIANCDPAGGSDPVSLVFSSRCGPEPCCPREPVRPAGCSNRMDDIFNSPGQCVNMMQDLGLKCEVDFCPTCGTMAGFCDLECGYGACASCGDCWRESAMSVGGTDRCDDGNSIDGDGCSSTCFVEPGFTCTKEQAGVGADTCEMCLDRENWTDAQGFTCEDYRTLDACDPGGSPADPVTPGGSQFRTPNYHDYTFVYDLSLTPSKALILFVTVQAEHDAHIFLGRPPGTPEVNLPAVGVHGFEIVIGGWKNGMSVIRRYPGQQELSRAYGARLNASERKEFWIYCSSNGTTRRRGH